jgi:DNA-binding NarL/FixJ family response regulator
MKILLADDHQMFREGLRTLLESNDGFEVVGEANDGREAVELARKLHPDVVVMDVAMPDLNGIEATRKIRHEPDAPKVVALSMHTDRRFTSEMIKAGANGYVPKDGAFEELAQAVRTVAAGKVYLSPRVAGAVVEEYVRSSGAPAAPAAAPSSNPSGRSAFEALTPREREVLQLMAEGQATKEIARSLDVSVKTVETHRRQIMEKLDIYSVAELTKYAIREGLTSVE